MRVRRAVAWTLLGLVLLLLLTIAAVVAALGTAWGTRWSLDLARALAPTLQVEAVEGDWLDGLRIGRLRWSNDDTGLDITDLHLRLRWPQLLNSQVQLQPLSAASITLALKGEPSDEPVKLPTLWLPVPLLTDLNVQRFAIEDHGAPLVAIEGLRADLRWSATQLRAANLELTWEQTRLSAQGQLQLRDDYPLQWRATVNDPRLPGTATANLSGSLRHLGVAASLDGVWPLQANAKIAPLDPHLPLSANIRLAKPVTWQLADDNVQLQAAEVKLHGDLQRLEGDLDLTLDEARYGRSRLRAPWSWQGQQLQVAPVWQPAQGLARADCTVGLGEPLSWRCAAALEQLSLTPWLQAVPGELTGALQVDGHWAEHKLQLSMGMPEFSGKLAGRPIAGELQLNTEDAEHWQLPQFTLSSGRNRLTASGEFGNRNQLQIDLSAYDLGALDPELKGAATASVSVSGELTRPDISGDLRARQLQYGNIRLALATADFSIAGLGLGNSQLRLDLNELALGEQPPLSLSLNASGNREAHQLNLTADQRDNLHSQLSCRGQLDRDFRDWRLTCPQWRGEFNSEPNERRRRTRIAWQQRDPVRGHWQIADHRFELAPFCLTANGAELCLDKTLRYRNQNLEPFALQGHNLPLAWIRPYLPGGLVLQNDAKAEAQLQVGSLSPLRLEASARVPETQWQWQLEDKQQQATLNDLLLEARLNDARADLSASVASPTLGSFAAQLSVLEPRGKRELSGTLDIRQLQLAGFAWLVSGLDTLSGQIDGHIQIAGEASALRLQGQMQLSNGVVGWAPLGDVVRDIHLTGRFDNNSADFRGGFALGGGSGDLTGDLHWQDETNLWDMRMNVDAKHIGITPLPDSKVVLAPRVALQVTPNRFITKGQVDIESAEIKVKELPPDTVRVSGDEQIVGEKPAESDWQMLTDVRLNLGNQFHFAGFGADVHLTGGVSLQRDVNQLFRANGEVKVTKGRYRAYGQRLLVRRGSFIFTGPWDNPDLNLEAIRELPPTANPTNVVVGIKVTGPLREPQAMLFSEPGMPESDIAYYILTGRPRAAPQANQVSAGGTLLALGLAGSGEQAGRLAKQFGIGDFQIGTVAGSNGTEAEMSGYLTPQLYVRYGRGLLQRSNTVTVQYRLTPRLLIETVSGIEDALDLLYSFNIK